MSWLRTRGCVSYFAGLGCIGVSPRKGAGGGGEEGDARNSQAPRLSGGARLRPRWGGGRRRFLSRRRVACWRGGSGGHLVLEARFCVGGLPLCGAAWPKYGCLRRPGSVWDLRGSLSDQGCWGVGLFTIAIAIALPPPRTLEGGSMGTSATIKVGEAYRGGDVGPETVG